MIYLLPHDCNYSAHSQIYGRLINAVNFERARCLTIVRGRLTSVNYPNEVCIRGARTVAGRRSSVLCLLTLKENGLYRLVELIRGVNLFFVATTLYQWLCQR